MRVQRNALPAILAGRRAAQAFFAFCVEGGAVDESLWVAHVDGQARCLHLGRYDGGSNAVGLPVRHILADALRLGSAGVLLAHNHPAATQPRARPTAAPPAYWPAPAKQWTSLW